MWNTIKMWEIPDLVVLLIAVFVAIWEIIRWRGQKKLAKQIENLKAEYAKKLTIHRVQFETEFAVYKDIWQAVYRLQSMSPITPSVDMLPTDPEAQKGEYLERILEAMKAFQKADSVVELYKPFYSTEIHELSSSLNKDCLRHLRHIRSRVNANQMNECYEMADKFRDDNRTRVEQLEIAIRRRIGMLDKVEIIG